MQDIEKLHTAFMAIAKEADAMPNPLTDAQFDDIVGFAGYREVSNAVLRAQRKDHASIAEIARWSRVAAAAAKFSALGLSQVNLGLVFAVFQAESTDRIRKVTIDASRGDSSAMAVLEAWMRNAAAAQSQSTVNAAMRDAQEQPAAVATPAPVRNVPVQRVQPDGAARTPTHPSPVPPPTADDPRTQPRPERSLASQPSGAQRQPAAAQSEQSNVRQIAQRAPSGDGDSHGRGHATTRTPEVTSGQRQYDQVSVYGREMAIQFERCANKDRDSNTINVSVAKAKGQSAKGGLNWDQKIILMLVPQEVQLIAAVLLGITAKVRFAGHGPDNKKWIAVERQTGQYAGIKFTVADKEDRRSVNVGFTDIGNVTAVFLRTLQDQLKVAAPAIPMVLRPVVAMYEEIQASKPQAPESQAPRAAAGGGR